MFNTTQLIIYINMKKGVQRNNSQQQHLTLCFLYPFLNALFLILSIAATTVVVVGGGDVAAVMVL